MGDLATAREHAARARELVPRADAALGSMARVAAVEAAITGEAPGRD